MKTIKKGMKVRYPFMGEGWARVEYVNLHTGRVEIKYPGSGYVVEVDATKLITKAS
jgi:hypothetical protein